MSVHGLIDAMRSNYPPAHRLVWQCLENHANGARWWRTTNKEIADELHLSKATVDRAADDLEKDDIIRRDFRRRKRTVFHMLRTYPNGLSHQKADPTTDLSHQNVAPTPVMPWDLNTQNDDSTLDLTNKNVDSTPDLSTQNVDSKNPPEKNPPVREESTRSARVRTRGVRKRVSFDGELLRLFNEFWLLYPRKRAKDDAKKAFLERVNAGDEPDAIIEGLKRHQFSTRADRRPYPATWLRRGQWSDEPDAPPDEELSQHERIRIDGNLPSHFGTSDPDIVVPIRRAIA
jgi:hypothetical protein